MELDCKLPATASSKKTSLLLLPSFGEIRVTCSEQKHLYPDPVLLFQEAYCRLLDTVPRLMYPTTGKSCVTIG